ncbi:MAG: hypothetical protein RSE12_17650 [Fuscovulum sp.]|jgi:hypothetical protein|nr:hypothetical protein [Paracoccaceae bacterium]MCZ8085001.1 hypothetical protein [Paracoccaceae bacterium]WRH62172.1 MAG: hypothetical protein RSE12_17650 [Fuscovulum sp.]
MSAIAIIILQKANRISELLEERLGVKGPSLEARLGRAGRVLPSEARQAGWRIALAERKAKLGDLAGIDEYSFDDDYRTCLRHLQMMAPGTPGLPHFRSALQSGVTAVLSVLILYIGLAFAGLI